MKKKQSFYYFYGKKSLLKIMRLLFILMTMTSMTISANGFSQEQRVTLDVKNVGAMELFKQIQKETNLFFVYNDADLISYNKISVSAKDEPGLHGVGFFVRGKRDYRETNTSQGREKGSEEIHD